MPDARLTAVYDAASYLFVTQGYARTQVAQIAKQAGIATGTIYNLFASKPAVLHFVLLSTLEGHKGSIDVELPLGEAKEQRLRERLDAVMTGFLQGIAASDGEEKPAFTQMLSVLFDTAADYNVALNIVNDNADALPRLNRQYQQYIHDLYGLIEDNLQDGMQRGEVRKILYPRLHIRNILEGITWWAMYLPYQEQQERIPQSTAKEIALDILNHAYLTDPKSQY